MKNLSLYFAMLLLGFLTSCTEQGSVIESTPTQTVDSIFNFTTNGFPVDGVRICGTSVEGNGEHYRFDINHRKITLEKLNSAGIRLFRKSQEDYEAYIDTLKNFKHYSRPLPVYTTPCSLEEYFTEFGLKPLLSLMRENGLSLYDWSSVSVRNGSISCTKLDGTKVSLVRENQNLENKLCLVGDSTYFSYEKDNYVLTRELDSVIIIRQVKKELSLDPIGKAQLLDLLEDNGSKIDEANYSLSSRLLRAEYSEGRPLFVASTKVGQIRILTGFLYQYSNIHDYVFNAYVGEPTREWPTEINCPQSNVFVHRDDFDIESIRLLLDFLVCEYTLKSSSEYEQIVISNIYQSYRPIPSHQISQRQSVYGMYQRPMMGAPVGSYGYRRGINSGYGYGPSSYGSGYIRHSSSPRR